LPLLVLGGGLTGMGLALLMQWWMNAHDYRLIISGSRSSACRRTSR